MKYERVCKHCGKTFKTNYWSKVFCNTVCLDEYHAKPSITKECQVCGRQFETSYKRQIYCSYACYDTASKLNEKMKRVANPEYGKEIYQKYKTYHKEYQREYRKKNKDKLKKYYIEWRRRKKDA